MRLTRDQESGVKGNDAEVKVHAIVIGHLLRPQGILSTPTAGFRVTPVSTCLIGIENSIAILTRCVWTFGWFMPWQRAGGNPEVFHPQQLAILSRLVYRSFSMEFYTVTWG